jgi:ADP-ribose pyrophosphatase YjhB (NUDIX family)
MASFVKKAGWFWKRMPPAARTFLSRVTNNTFTVSVAAIVLNSQGKVLLLNHVLRPGSGWGLPGGFIDYGEQPVTGLRRELSEETGIELTNIEIYNVTTINKHVEVLFTARSSGDPKVMSEEIIELAWFSANDLPEEMNPAQQSLIQKILRGDV